MCVGPTLRHADWADLVGERQLPAEPEQGDVVKRVVVLLVPDHFLDLEARESLQYGICERNLAALLKKLDVSPTLYRVSSVTSVCLLWIPAATLSLGFSGSQPMCWSSTQWDAVTTYRLKRRQSTSFWGGHRIREVTCLRLFRRS